MIAALVHIVAILIIPLYATNDAFARLSQLGALNATIVLDSAGPRSGIPFPDPAIASAFCRFDLTAGPLRVRAPVDSSGFASLSFHSRHGGVFYAITDKAATHGVLEALVLTEAQLRAVRPGRRGRSRCRNCASSRPTPQGFVLMRALSEEPSLYPRAESRARGLTCASEAIAD